MAHQAKHGNLARPMQANRAGGHSHTHRSPPDVDTTLSALVREVARRRQMLLVAKTPALLCEAREAREAMTLPRGHGGGSQGDDGLAHLVASMAFGFAHDRQPPDG
ncbi:hypothetical protein TW95_gp1120 [Pandoravirus inopinatum]|uniref:Uncharacterized protein n=1 Tax=Pandoravirus inopinatum TaxID=1605721 RepID=A0A0B5J2Q8_9VIRU|nr:hypothetical protein TW95_gp1120 [Pandoravirus inopinatum]AJF97854.1 hypothetical protein [Pandoravirus inopinatum]